MGSQEQVEQVSRHQCANLPKEPVSGPPTKNAIPLTPNSNPPGQGARTLVVQAKTSHSLSVEISLQTNPRWVKNPRFLER